jgi:hypothetical protein
LLTGGVGEGLAFVLLGEEFPFSFAGRPLWETKQGL